MLGRPSRVVKLRMRPVAHPAQAAGARTDPQVSLAVGEHRPDDVAGQALARGPGHEAAVGEAGEPAVLHPDPEVALAVLRDRAAPCRSRDPRRVVKISKRALAQARETAALRADPEAAVAGRGGSRGLSGPGGLRRDRAALVSPSRQRTRPRVRPAHSEPSASSHSERDGTLARDRDRLLGRRRSRSDAIEPAGRADPDASRRGPRAAARTLSPVSRTGEAARPSCQATTPSSVPTQSRPSGIARERAHALAREPVRDREGPEHAVAQEPREAAALGPDPERAGRVLMERQHAVVPQLAGVRAVEDREARARRSARGPPGCRARGSRPASARAPRPSSAAGRRACSRPRSGTA